VAASGQLRLNNGAPVMILPETRWIRSPASPVLGHCIDHFTIFSSAGRARCCRQRTDLLHGLRSMMGLSFASSQLGIVVISIQRLSGAAGTDAGFNHTPIEQAIPRPKAWTT